MFEKYQKLMQQNNDWDILDAVDQVYERYLRYKKSPLNINSSKGLGFEGRVVTTLLCDECQDLVMKQMFQTI